VNKMDIDAINVNFKNFLENIEFEKLLLEDKIKVLNGIRKILGEVSPFKDNPVESIQWIRMEKVEGNEYNPNKVAPPEMKLLYVSIRED